MSATENKALVRRYFEAISGKDKPRALQDEYIADSDEELKEHIVFFEAAFPHYELLVDDMVAEGEKVAVRVTFKGTHQGEFMGIAPTGKDVSIPISLIYRITGGRIVEHWMLAEQLGLMQQLGAAPV
jgi:predicted ester cyclase